MKALPEGTTLVRRLVPVLMIAAVAALVYAPVGLGSSGGANKDTIADPTFGAVGCTACHGDHAFAAGDNNIVSWTITDAEGNALAGNIYEHGAEYTVKITLDEQNAPTEDNHAGFNLRVSAGELAAVEGESQVSEDHTEATHLDPSRTSWTVLWTAPEEGVVVFDLFVNDVNGNAIPDAGDEVLRVGWWITDDPETLPGAQAEEEHVEFGVTLQQYWIGLIGIAGMGIILIFGYIYLKYANPHNADQQDR